MILFVGLENVKVTTMRGATKIYVNLDIPELAEFKKRYNIVKSYIKMCLYNEFWLTVFFKCRRTVDHDAQSSRLSAVTNDSEDIRSKAKIASLEEIKCTEQVSIIKVIWCSTHMLLFLNESGSSNSLTDPNRLRYKQ